jgi:hypothetical protein
MLPALILAPEPQDNVLDLCAAPGSKTTQVPDRRSRQLWLWLAVALLTSTHPHSFSGSFLPRATAFSLPTTRIGFG